MTAIEKNLKRITKNIQDICRDCGRKNRLTLLAVSKKRSLDEIQQAIEAGCCDFGESYLQEALPKIRELAHKNLNWHFLGPIQSNKTQAIASHFQWVHSVDRSKIAVLLDRHRPEEMGALNICLQVNISKEPNKSGVAYEDLDQLLATVKDCDKLSLRGLMGMAQNTQDKSVIRRSFAQLRETLERLNSTGLALDTLSMGMTNDMEEAIREGSTIIRIGTGLFGPRI